MKADERVQGVSPAAQIGLSIAVQHHPARAALIPHLVYLLGDCEVLEDPDPTNPKPSPWRTYRRCLELTPAHATHRLIVQDDAIPCEGFREKAEAAIAEHPDALIAFFVPGSTAGGRNRMIRAARQGERWTALGYGGFIPVVATSWPVELIAPFLEWVDAKRIVHAADDGLVGRWARRAHPPIMATVPSLVEHPDTVESLIGKKAAGGANKARVAAVI